jgi:hypothetical protein
LGSGSLLASTSGRLGTDLSGVEALSSGDLDLSSVDGIRWWQRTRTSPALTSDQMRHPLEASSIIFQPSH